MLLSIAVNSIHWLKGTEYGVEVDNKLGQELNK